MDYWRDNETGDFLTEEEAYEWVDEYNKAFEEDEDLQISIYDVYECYSIHDLFKDWEEGLFNNKHYWNNTCSEVRRDITEEVEDYRS